MALNLEITNDITKVMEIPVGTFGKIERLTNNALSTNFQFLSRVFAPKNKRSG
jgi:hypothetical protein